MRVAIVTDSTSDIDPAVARALDLVVVPLFVNFGDRRYRDGVDLDREEFYRRLASESQLPTTTQPTAKMFEDAFAPLVADGRPIVGIFISQKLSGTINAARAAADQFPGKRIELVDSLTATAGLGLQAMHAAELARGGSTVDEILAALADDRTHQHGFAALPDLSHAVRTGRIGKARAAIGGMLKIVPVLRLDRGEVEEQARVRTFARAQDEMIAFGSDGLQLLRPHHALECFKQRGQRNRKLDIVQQPPDVLQGVWHRLQEVRLAFVESTEPVGAHGLHDAYVHVRIVVLHVGVALDINKGG